MAVIDFCYDVALIYLRVLIYYQYMTNDMKVLKVLGERLRKARGSAKLTQSEVAAKANVSVNYYARIERGEENPTYERLQSIMKTLNIKSLDIT